MPDTNRRITMFARLNQGNTYPVTQLDCENREVTMLTECGYTTYPFHKVNYFTWDADIDLLIVPS